LQIVVGGGTWNDVVVIIVFVVDVVDIIVRWVGCDGGFRASVVRASVDVLGARRFADSPTTAADVACESA